MVWVSSHNSNPLPRAETTLTRPGRYFKTVCKSSISLCLIMSSEIHHIHFSQSKTEKYTAYCMQILSYIIYPIYHEAYLKLRYSFLHALINPRSACTNSCTVNLFCYWSLAKIDQVICYLTCVMEFSWPLALSSNLLGSSFPRPLGAFLQMATVEKARAFLPEMTL